MFGTARLSLESSPMINPFEGPAARRAFLAEGQRIDRLSEIDRDLVRLGQMPDMARWLEQITATGGCAHPIYLAGRSATYDAVSGELLRHYSTAGEPGGRLAMRCRNRRSARCGPCSWLYQGDAWQLVRAGLVGGKGVPNEVHSRPMVFVTLTAPSFGRVHRAGECHRPRPSYCEHGLPLGCGRLHPENHPIVGQPICPGCYDYVGQVLWNAHAGALWKALTDNLYHHVARRAGFERLALRRLVRVSAAKVAEYQRRGAVHFHAVLRMDGPEGPCSLPPPWASVGLLLEAVRTAAGAVALAAPESPAYGVRSLCFGGQLEVHPITAGEQSGLVDERAAAYLAKYTTKGSDAAGSVDWPIRSDAEIRALTVSPHVRALIGTCWRLGALVELEHLRLRAWAHMLGYRGHCLTKSQMFSTTFRHLRDERAAYLRVLTGREPFTAVGEVTESVWRFVGSGHSVAESLIAAGIAEDLKRARELAHGNLSPGRAGGARREPERAESERHSGADYGP